MAPTVFIVFWMYEISRGGVNNQYQINPSNIRPDYSNDSVKIKEEITTNFAKNRPKKYFWQKDNKLKGAFSFVDLKWLKIQRELKCFLSDGGTAGDFTLLELCDYHDVFIESQKNEIRMMSSVRNGIDFIYYKYTFYIQCFEFALVLFHVKTLMTRLTEVVKTNSTIQYLGEFALPIIQLVLELA